MRKCFVMMPFGSRKIKLRKFDELQDVDFDKIYAQMIEPGIEAAGLKPHRADRVHMAGIISQDMFDNIFNFEAAIADISVPNPNVFYELGVRHALCKYCTLLIRNAEAAPMSHGGDAPFDLNDVRFISYTHDDKGMKAAAGLIATFLKTSLEGKRVDSPVHSVLPYLTVARRGQPLLEGRPQKHRFRLKNRPDFVLGIIAGALQKVEGIDVWVNSENTQFEMARVFESSVSSTIRYLGSTKTTRDGTEVLGDEIYKELSRRKKKLVGNKAHVTSTTVVLTRPYELSHAPYHVKQVAHVASVTGTNMKGFEPVQDRRGCVRNILTAISDHNAKRFGQKKNKLRSVLIPLLGAGQARGNPALFVDELLSAVLEYLKDTGDAWLREVYFLAFLDAERDLLLRELGKYPELEKAA